MIGVFRGVALGAIVRKVGASRRGAPNQPGFIARRTPRMPDPLSPAPHTPIYPDLPPREEMTTGGAHPHDQQAAQRQQQQQQLHWAQSTPRLCYAANAAASGAGANSDSDEDDMFVAKQPSSSIGLAAAASNAEEEEEDLVRREEELRAELNFATMRCEELKRTLQETKSFLGPRLPTRGRPQAGVSSAIGGARPSAPPASVAALGGGGIAVVEDD
eukprot:gene32872-42261_t